MENRIIFQTVFVKNEFINSKFFKERIEDLSNEFGINVNVECEWPERKKKFPDLSDPEFVFVHQKNK